MGKRLDRLVEEKRAGDLVLIAEAARALAQVLGSRGTRWSPPAYQLIRQALENLQKILAAHGRTIHG